MKHHETHPEYVEGCFGCKLTTIAMFDVETGDGRGTTPQRMSARKIARDVEAYAGARKSGLRPETSTREGVEKAEKRAEQEARVAKKLGFGNINEAIKPLKDVM
jgi:hypothetical protein